jgi:hypothetical protein
LVGVLGIYFSLSLKVKVRVVGKLVIRSQNPVSLFNGKRNTYIVRKGSI